VQENDFQYESQSKQMLEDLIEQAKEEKYYELASGEFEEIKAKLEPQLDKDLTVFSKEIKSLLKNEIVSRYYYQKGAIRATIDDDEVILKAVDELKSPISYTSYFEPGIIITMKRP
jgi:carboxyl-terminal processing protease